jgi:hypothetical protein
MTLLRIALKILPRFRNSENVKMPALPSSVPRCSFLHQKPDLSFIGFRRHELPYGIKHDLKLSTVCFPDLACLLHFLRQDLIDERLIRQSLLLSGFPQPTQNFRI